MATLDQQFQPFRLPAIAPNRSGLMQSLEPGAKQIVDALQADEMRRAMVVEKMVKEREALAAWNSPGHQAMLRQLYGLEAPQAAPVPIQTAPSAAPLEQAATMSAPTPVAEAPPIQMLDPAVSGALRSTWNGISPMAAEGTVAPMLLNAFERAGVAPNIPTSSPMAQAAPVQQSAPTPPMSRPVPMPLTANSLGELELLQGRLGQLGQLAQDKRTAQRQADDDVRQAALRREEIGLQHKAKMEELGARATSQKELQEDRLEAAKDLQDGKQTFDKWLAEQKKKGARLSGNEKEIKDYAANIDKGVQRATEIWKRSYTAFNTASSSFVTTPEEKARLKTESDSDRKILDALLKEAADTQVAWKQALNRSGGGGGAGSKGQPPPAAKGHGKEVRRQVNAKTGQTRVTYEDGFVEVK